MELDLFFSKYFRYVNVFYVNYRQYFQIRAQLVADKKIKNYNKRDYIMVPELSSWFLWLWPIVFVKFLWSSCVLLSFLILFVAQSLCVPNQRSGYILEIIKKSRHFCQLLSNFCYDFEYICFEKILVYFWNLSYFLRAQFQKKQLETDFLWVINYSIIFN